MIRAKPSPLRARVRRFGHRLGVDVRRYAPHSSTAARRVRIVANRRISVVLDIGANVGHYAKDLRSAGYDGRIISFEPLSEPFEALCRASHRDAEWRCLQLALGTSNGATTMNVAANQAASSSLLPMESWVREGSPEQAYVGTEIVQVTRLDDAAPPLITPEDRVMVKLDVQGYEFEVLRGGKRTLGRADIVEAELSLVPLYEGQVLWRQVLDYLQAAGYEVVSLDPILHDDDGRLLQMDGIFVRSGPRDSPDM